MEKMTVSELKAELIERGVSADKWRSCLEKSDFQKLLVEARKKSPEVQSVKLEYLVKQLEQDSSNAGLWYAAAVQNSPKVLINGVEYTRKERYEKCRTLDPDPTKARYWHCLGYAEGGTVGGRSYSEKECYLEALRIDPQYAKAWNGLGFTGGGTVAGRDYSQKECYLEALRIDPQYTNAWNNLGNQNGGTVAGRSYSKKECYLEALRIDPQYSLARNALAQLN